MSLDNEIQKAMASVPECLAAGYVDMSTGMLLSVKTVDSHPQEVLDTVAAATADLFQGANVTAIENMFKKHRGADGDDRHYFNEIIVFSENLLHAFLRSKKYPEHVLVFVTRKSANIGMVIAKSRMAVDPVSEAV